MLAYWVRPYHFAENFGRILKWENMERTNLLYIKSSCDYTAPVCFHSDLLDVRCRKKNVRAPCIPVVVVVSH